MDKNHHNFIRLIHSNKFNSTLIIKFSIEDLDNNPNLIIGPIGISS